MPAGFAAALAQQLAKLSQLRILELPSILLSNTLPGHLQGLTQVREMHLSEPSQLNLPCGLTRLVVLDRPPQEQQEQQQQQQGEHHEQEQQRQQQEQLQLFSGLSRLSSLSS